MEKEKWKDDVLNSLAGIQSAEPNPFLFTRIESRIQRSTGMTKMQVRFAGVTMLFLLLINLWVATQRSDSTAINSNSLTTTYRY